MTRDESFSPILVLSLKNFDLKRLDSETNEIAKSLLFFIKIVREYMLLPYFVETFKIVVDFANKDLLPFTFVQFTYFGWNQSINKRRKVP